MASPLAPPLRRLALGFALLALSGCEAPRFATDRDRTSQGPFPVIRPLNEVLAESDPTILEPTDTAALQARAAALQAQAATLSAAETDPETRARLEAAIDAGGT